MMTPKEKPPEGGEGVYITGSYKEKPPEGGEGVYITGSYKA
jgi:hypothetical protein